MSNPKTLNSIDIYARCQFDDSDGIVREIIPLNPQIVGEVYDLFKSICEEHIEHMSYVEHFSIEKMEYALNKACIDLFRSVNYHDYRESDQTKYISRMCFFWLKVKPISVKQNSGIPHAMFINESFIAQMVGNYLFTILKKSEIDQYEDGTLSDADFLKVKENFAHSWFENQHDLRYYFSSQSVTLHMIETYINGIIKYYKNFC